MLDPSLAPGYLAWVVNDGRHAHVGVAGYPDRFPNGLRRALGRFGSSAPGLPSAERPDEVERRGGPIPVGGVLRRISCANGLLVGNAAGAVSPLTAGGLDPCLRLSEVAAAVLDDALRSGRPDALSHYDGAALRAHSGAGSRCAGDWPTCARPLSRRLRSRCCARQWARPRPAESSSVTVPSPFLHLHERRWPPPVLHSARLASNSSALPVRWWPGIPLLCWAILGTQAGILDQGWGDPR